MEYNEFKRNHPDIKLDSNYFDKIEIKVFKEKHTIKSDLKLDELKHAMVCLDGLEVQGNISNSFAGFGMPLIVLGETKAKSLFLSGNLYLDLSLISIEKIIAIYVYEEYVHFSKGYAPVFLDDTEFSHTILFHINTDNYISEFINPQENAKNNFGFSFFAGLYPQTSWVKTNKYFEDDLETFMADYGEYQEYLFYKPSKNTTSAWDIVEKDIDIEEFMNQVNSVFDKNYKG